MYKCTYTTHICTMYKYDPMNDVRMYVLYMFVLRTNILQWLMYVYTAIHMCTMYKYTPKHVDCISLDCDVTSSEWHYILKNIYLVSFWWFAYLLFATNIINTSISHICILKRYVGQIENVVHYYKYSNLKFYIQMLCNIRWLMCHTRRWRIFLHKAIFGV